MEIVRQMKFVDGNTFQPKIRLVMDFSLEYLEDSIRNELIKAAFYDKFIECIEESKEKSEQLYGMQELFIVPYKLLAHFSGLDVHHIKSFTTWVPSDIINLTQVSAPVFLNEDNEQRELNTVLCKDFTITEAEYESMKTDVEARINFYKKIEETLVNDGYKYIYTTCIRKSTDVDTFLPEFKIVARVAK